MLKIKIKDLLNPNLLLKTNLNLLSLISKRRIHDKCRVRFAPSPTGYLHLGGLRTALYNYLFAKRNNGKFILRIEDTDQSRIVPGSMEQLIKDLEWAGINMDENPIIGGEYGPYVQSLRLDLYKNEVNKLIQNGSAYYCFCSERRLELLRKEAIRLRQVPKYDNKCRYLNESEIKENFLKNKPHCVRFKLTSYTESINDLVYGKVHYNVAENEGDPVIIKTDGYPTYHFANVVDDHAMNISHVFRGVEWQISTTKHLLLYKAFNWSPPQFGHLPLLINSDGTKLSKRQGDIQISQYKDKGIFPQALINYISLAGGGYDREQSIKPKSYNMNELISQFNINKVNSHPSKLNPDLLSEFNRLEIERLLLNEETSDQLVNDVKSLVIKAYPTNHDNLDLDPSHIKDILNWSSNRIASLNDLVDSKLSFLWIKPPKDVQIDLKESDIKQLVSLLQSANFDKQNLHILLKEFAKTRDIKFSNFMHDLRRILSGLKEGPSVSEIMIILGRDKTLNRISKVSN